MIRPASLLLLLACAPCPRGDADAPRARRLLDPLGARARVCFVPNGPSVLQGDVALLERDLPDDVATARLAHLLHHRGFVAPTGPGCLSAWKAEERAARVVEDAWRARAGLAPLGVDPPPDLVDALGARCEDAAGGLP